MNSNSPFVSNGLPNFLIIGAAKSATSFFARQLSGNPKIFICDCEPHFFSLNYHKGIDWYSKNFQGAGNNTLVAEKSNTYLYMSNAPERICSMLPNVKILAILRNPIERAYAGYCMQYAVCKWKSE